MLRIGRIDYANCTPLFMQLDGHLASETAVVVHGVPSALNLQLAAGEIDICISSSIEFLRHADEYAILPGHCIGSNGPVKSVLLFTNRPIEQLHGQELLVTSESATSIVLLQILLALRWGVSDCSIKVSSLSCQDALQQAPGLLLIGDNALQTSSSVSGRYCYDLGQEWKELTGLPFVYALWLVNLRSAEGKEVAIRQFHSLIDQVRERIIPDAEQLAEQAPEARWFGQQALADYWCNAITYRLDADHLAGLKRFYQLAAQLNLVSSASEPVFYKL